MIELYEQIGVGYNRFRRADPRIEKRILHALAEASSVINVGAGSGAYEPTDRFVVALEPSKAMIRQRASNKNPVVRGHAASLPFRDNSFDAALAILTVHHWQNPGFGLRELARVAKTRIVILTWDPASTGFWLVDEYFPEILQIDRTIFPSMEDFRHALGEISISTLSIPHDCSAGFLGAYWRRPEAYLNPEIRNAISTFRKLNNFANGLKRLKRDLDSGEWHRRHGNLISRKTLDLGYRLIVVG